MQYLAFNQRNEFPPVNYSNNPSSYLTSYHHNQNWYVPEFHQTPYELFAKPELPVQWPIESQMNAELLTENNGNVGGPTVGSAGGPTGGNVGGPIGSPTDGPTSYFYNGNGQIDFDKVLSTVGQLANTYHQVSPIVKQFSTLVKTFR
ncbi:YppG family protein [Oceanobacillus sp. CF4.6]|uniref:YppG family protein n=1 Tax=Oceanobacillus sp. CF4.6 TaxID=3373080 RepID=UPI003EE4782E